MVTFQKLLVSSTAALRRSALTRISKLAVPLLTKQVGEGDEADQSQEYAELLIGSTSDANEIDFWKSVVSAIERLRAFDSKTNVLLADLRGLFADDPHTKVLIFTQFRETQEYLRTVLSRHYSVEVFHGGLSRDEKDQAVQSFREHVQVLISTDAGSEGRNFQFCHVIVNYDLPWNPMKVEQRIGRLDRIGQNQDVLIFNYKTLGTIEDRIVDVLHSRIRLFENSVGSLDPILENVEADLERLLLSGAPDQFANWSNNLESEIQRALESQELLSDFLMDKNSYRREKVQELLGEKPTWDWKDLKGFVISFLNRYIEAGSRAAGPIIQENSDGTYWIHPPDAFLIQCNNAQLADAYHGTFDPAIALEREDLHFFAFGHPLVDAIAKHCMSAQFSGHVTRRHVRLPDPPTDRLPLHLFRRTAPSQRADIADVVWYFDRNNGLLPRVNQVLRNKLRSRHEVYRL